VRRSPLRRFAGITLAAAFVAGCGGQGRTRVDAAAGPYPYGGKTFDSFVTDSYGGSHGPGAFRKWLDERFRAVSPDVSRSGGIGGWLKARRARIRTSADEISLCRDVHAIVKKAIPRFSLDRGFEFRYTVQYGERQCFLQSVLIAGLLQDAGVNAGVVMVWINEKGQESNLGHAVTLVRLRDGSHIVVDASEQRPFATHQGLFALVGGKYAFLKPEYSKADQSITAWRRASGAPVSSRAIGGLPVDFLRSQFEFYRGERAPGGLVADKPTREGLTASAAHFRKAVALCSRNPLAVFSLARTLEILGDTEASSRVKDTARALYRDAGWIPSSLQPNGTNGPSNNG
jgi:hypothetical protein